MQTHYCDYAENHRPHLLGQAVDDSDGEEALTWEWSVVVELACYSVRSSRLVQGAGFVSQETHNTLLYPKTKNRGIFPE